jgi:hypothetical protein
VLTPQKSAYDCFAPFLLQSLVNNMGKNQRNSDPQLSIQFSFLKFVTLKET